MSVVSVDLFGVRCVMSELCLTPPSPISLSLSLSVSLWQSVCLARVMAMPSILRAVHRCVGAMGIW